MPRKPKSIPTTQIKRNNLQQSIFYSMPNKYKILKYNTNPELDKLYKSWNIKIDNFTPEVNISNFMVEKIIPFNKYFDSNFQSSWENKIYNLHLPKNFTDYKTIKYDDVRKGKYLSSSEDASGAKISITTEKKYLSALLSLDTFQNLDDLTDPTNMNWLIEKEMDLIPDLIKQSNRSKWALATFNDKLKAIRRYLLLMLGDDHELRIKYSILYGNLDYIIQFDKGSNESGGDDLLYFNDLLKIVSYLEESFKVYYDPNDDHELKNKNNINNAFKANMDFLAVACMVWDYPSRSDKYDTVVIKDKKDAVDKKTYLVNDGTNMLYWIYKKDIKDIGRPLVIVPMESKGLEGDQKRLNDAIKLSLELFPRKYLFVNKNTNWKNPVGDLKPAKTVSDWVRDLTKSKINKQGIETNMLLRSYPKLATKTLGINVFRRSFVTHYIDKMNNNEKRKMVHGMLTSFTKIDTYYKRKFDTVELKSKVKLEYEVPQPDTERIVITEKKDIVKEVEEEVEKTKPMTPAERQRKYYASKKGDEKFQEKRSKIENDPKRRIKRIIRELNNKKKNFKTMLPSTIKEFGISYKDGQYVSSKL